jgi:REP element-mobilizing transposase RayT
MAQLPSHGHLPRLAPEFYRGHAIVHWVMTVERRATGWLDDVTHARLREVLLHTLVRHELLCPVYCLMPDHAHFVWMGVAPDADQRRAAAFFRRRTQPLLSPQRWQQEAYDHVLRDSQRERGAFQGVCHYVRENPVRSALVASAGDYRFSGALAPGFPDLDPGPVDFWNVFWRAFGAEIERRSTAPSPVRLPPDAEPSPPPQPRR